MKRCTRSVAVLLVMSMLSACGGGPRPQIENRLAQIESRIDRRIERRDIETRGRDMQAYETRERNADPRDLLAIEKNAAPEEYYDEGDDYYDDLPPSYYYDEPSPRAQRAAESALLLTGAVFLCSFVVVVLDGACNFGAGFGYYY